MAQAPAPYSADRAAKCAGKESNVARAPENRTDTDGAGANGRMLTTVAQRYRSALNAYFRRRVDPPHESEDLTQDVLLRLAARDGATDVRALQPYIFQTASNVLNDYYRRRAARGGAMIDSYCEELHAPADISPEQAMLGQEAMDRLSREIAALPDRARQAFLLFRFEGMRQADIARHMGISVSAVEKLIKRGMTGIASALAEGD